jgi:hypothetical protein
MIKAFMACPDIITSQTKEKNGAFVARRAECRSDGFHIRVQ